MKPAYRTLLLALALAAPSVRAAETAAPAKADKSNYTFSNPTPTALMREMSTDRPDKTECPFTIDAGHVQIELDMAVYARDHDTAGGADTRTTSWAFVPVNIKLGLTNSSDIQFVIEPINRERSEDRTVSPAAVDRVSGFGDVTVRYKQNFWGNDGGPSAFAIMPFVKFPTNTHGIGNNAVEGGVILPYAHDLADGWGLGVQTEFDLTKNDGRSGYHGEWINSITFGHDLGGKFGGYVELFSQHSFESGSRWVGTLDLGVTYGATENIQLDAGVNIGISPAAPDVEFFTGVSFRF